MFRPARSSATPLIRSLSLALCIILALSSNLVALSGNNSRARTRSKPSSQNVLRTPGPKPNLPSLDVLRHLTPRPPKAADPIPSTKCGHRDKICQQKEKKSTGQLAPASLGLERLLARADISPSMDFSSSSTDWRLDSSLPGVWPVRSLRSLSDLSPAAPSAPPVMPQGGPSANDLAASRLDPKNRTGALGEDLFSGNFNWTLPLFGVPGRAGLDLGLTLSYNSLVWVKTGSTMTFDPDNGYPAPGFQLGFPVIEPQHYNAQAGVNAYLLVLPSGGRMEFRQTGTDLFETADSSYLHLTVNQAANILTVRTTDGAQHKYQSINNAYRCTEIKDRNGNYLTINYTSFGAISGIIDTLGRIFLFEYDGNNHLLRIRYYFGGFTSTWVSFGYDVKVLYHNFAGLSIDGPGYGAGINVLAQVGLADGSLYKFEYNIYGQAKIIRRYAPNDDLSLVQRSFIKYNLPDDGTAQSDCPRFTTREFWALEWYDPVTGPIASFSINQSYYDSELNRTVVLGQATVPDGTVYKEFFSSSGWDKGLPLKMEVHNSGLKKKTLLNWAQDNTGLSYQLNPRTTETNVYDEASNRRRATISYTSYGLPSDVYEYAANGTTLLRRTHTDYNLSTTYTDRRILGLVSAQYLYDGSNNLFSKVDYQYDWSGEYLADQGNPEQHDGTSYGASFVAGRGNLSSVRRWDVTDPNNVNKAIEVARTGYNTSGSVIFTRDALGHQTSLSYTDSFTDGQSHNTKAYPTTITDPDSKVSTIQYDYTRGRVARTVDPKGAAVARSYDEAGRLTQVTNQVNGAYTRYVYASNQYYVQSYTTINDLNPANEFYTITVFDGADRVRGVVRDHPSGTGTPSNPAGWSSVYNVYDHMGRLAQRSNPTEINSGWAPAGDDQYLPGPPPSGGYIWSQQAYDWQGRPTVTTNQNGTTRQIDYTGCGCAGGAVITTTDEVGRKQRMTHDVLGRVMKTEILKQNGGQWETYSTTANTYNVRDQATQISQIVGTSGTSQAMTIEYDGHGRLWKRRRPIETSDTVFSYFDDDQVQTVADARGAATTYGYNNRHLLTSAVYSVSGSAAAATSNVTFQYNELGQRTQMDDGPGVVNYNYDTLGRMTSETRTFDLPGAPAGPFTISYDEYNLAGQVKKVKDPFNAELYYGYDKAGRLTGVTGTPFAGVTDYLSNVSYRAWGGVKNNRTYDERLRLISYNGYFSVNYEYNGAGQLTYAEQLSGEPYHQSFGYDEIGRPTGVSTPEIPAPSQYIATPGVTPPNGLPSGFKLRPFTASVSYDEFGNVTSRTNTYWFDFTTSANSQVFQTTYENGRAKKDGVPGRVFNNLQETWVYDAAGNIINDNRDQQDYDVVGQLVRTQNLNDANLYTNHTYDGDGRQVKFEQKRANGGYETEVRYRLYSSVLGKLLTEVDASGQKLETYVYTLDNELYRQVKAYTVYFPGQGNVNYPDTLVSEFTDPQGTRARRWDRDTNSYKYLHISPVGVYTEAIDWQVVRDRFVGTISSYYSYAQQAAARYQGAWASVEDPKNPGRGCMLDGQKVGCEKLLRDSSIGTAVIRSIADYNTLGTVTLTKAGQDNTPGSVFGRQLVRMRSRNDVRTDSSQFNDQTTAGGEDEEWFEVTGLQSFADDINTIREAPDDVAIRRYAEEFFNNPANRECVQLINGALQYLYNHYKYGVSSLKGVLNNMKFVDATDPAVSRIPSFTASISEAPVSGVFDRPLGVLLAMPGNYAVTNFRLPKATAFFGATFKDLGALNYKKEQIAAHETLHVAFRGNHRKIADAIGLYYNASNPLTADTNARLAIDYWLAKHCNLSFPFYAP